MTTAIAAYNWVDEHAADERDDVLLAVARLNAGTRRRDTAVVDAKPGWQFSEEEIVRTAITVILVALGVMIGVAAVAIATMG
jgi:hypothetical protein